MEWPQELLDLFEDSILDGVRPNAAPITHDDRRVKTLIEITEWVEVHDGRMPQNTGDLKEKIMAKSLVAIKRDAHDGLRVYDRLNLLKEEEE